LTTHYEFLVNENGDISLYYHNVESLRAHREDVANDNIICSANFLCFVETWTLPQEDFRDFDTIRRIDCNRLNGIGKNGILLYAKQNISKNVLFMFETKKSTNTKATYQSIAFKYLVTTFIIVYRSPGFPIARFRN